MNYHEATNQLVEIAKVYLAMREDYLEIDRISKLKEAIDIVERGITVDDI